MRRFFTVGAGRIILIVVLTLFTTNLYHQLTSTEGFSIMSVVIATVIGAVVGTILHLLAPKEDKKAKDGNVDGQ